MQHVDKSAYSHARKKYDYTVYKYLNSTFLNSVRAKYLSNRFHGLRILGIDGSLFDLPKSKSLEKEFTVIKAANGDSGPRARVSALYDCLNHVTYDTLIEPKTIGERELASQHIDSVELNKQDMLLFDRGYESFWLFSKVTQSGGHFCARMPMRWNEVKKFKSASDETDKIVTIKLNSANKKLCRQHGAAADFIKVRLVKIELESGETEILATSLYESSYSIDFFKELYNLRWQTEENYKVIKCRIRMEKFIGRTPDAIRQEFYARMFMLNITSVIRHEADKQLKQKEQCRKRKNKSKVFYKVNFKAALSKIRRTALLMFTAVTEKRTSETIKAIVQKITEDITKVIPGRSNDRTKRNIHGEFQTYSGI